MVTSDLIGVQTVGIIHLNWKSDTVIMDVSEDLIILDENDLDTAVTLIWNYRENALGRICDAVSSSLRMVAELYFFSSRCYKDNIRFDV